MMVTRMIFFLLLSGLAGRAQQPARLTSLSGSVRDSVTREPLPFLTVILRAMAGGEPKYTLSDSLGTFVFRNLQAGNYALSFTMPGYKPMKISDILVGDATILPPSFLSPSTIELSTVAITAGRLPVSATVEGFIYDARREIPVPGENSADMLRKLPVLTVSPEGTPGIRGSTAIKVFIDRRPAEMLAGSIAEALRQLPAENVSRIELITHPSARYDAEGAEAVILIFTKKPANKGFSGITNAQASNRNASLTQNVDLSGGKWIEGFSAGYYHSSNPTGRTVLRTENDGSGFLRQKRDSRQLSHSEFAAFNAIYNIDTLRSWNAGYRFGKMRGREHADLQSTLSYGTFSNELSRSTHSASGTATHTLNGGYVKRSADRKAELNLLGLYFYQAQSGSYALRELSRRPGEYLENSHTGTGNQEGSLQLDFSRQMARKSSFETGFKAVYRDFRNSNELAVYDAAISDYLPDALRSKRFWFGRWVLAGYAGYAFSLSEWKFRTGLRYEHTLLNLESDNRPVGVPDYKNLLPALLIARSIPGGHQVSMAYSKKLARPYIVYLNPLANYIDSLNIEYGNPLLRPVITHSTETTYAYVTKVLVMNVSLFMNANANSIENVRTLKTGGRTESTFLNVAHSRVLGGVVSLSLRPGKWSFNTNHTVRNTRYESWLASGAFDGTVSSHYLNAGYRFSPAFSLEISGTLNAGVVDFQNRETGSQWYSLLANRTFSKGKCGFSLRLDNLATPTQYINQETEGTSFRQYTRRSYPLLLTRIGFFCKIGKKEVQVPAVRRIGTEN